jgi:hypothetical protein
MELENSIEQSFKFFNDPLFLNPYNNLCNKELICVSFLPCTRTVDTLELNRLHARDQDDWEVQHWPLIFPKSDRWSNNRGKGYATNTFSWDNSVP